MVWLGASPPLGHEYLYPTDPNEIEAKKSDKSSVTCGKIIFGVIIGVMVGTIFGAVLAGVLLGVTGAIFEMYQGDNVWAILDAFSLSLLLGVQIGLWLGIIGGILGMIFGMLTHKKLTDGLVIDGAMGGAIVVIVGTSFYLLAAFAD